MFNEISSKNPQILGTRLWQIFMQNFKSQIYFVLHIKFKLSFDFIMDILQAINKRARWEHSPYCLMELIQFILKVSASYTSKGNQIIFERFRQWSFLSTSVKKWFITSYEIFVAQPFLEWPTNVYEKVNS